LLTAVEKWGGIEIYIRKLEILRFPYPLSLSRVLLYGFLKIIS